MKKIFNILGQICIIAWGGMSAIEFYRGNITHGEICLMITAVFCILYNQETAK